MPAKLEGFQPVVPAVGAGVKVRIEHIYTGRSTVEPLPYLVDAQHRTDRLAGRGTWVLVGAVNEEFLLTRDLRNIFDRRARETGDRSQCDGGRWGVRGTPDLKNLSPKDDCIVVTTNEELHLHMMAAEGVAPRQFSDKITFMLNLGWGDVMYKSARAYDSLVRFAFDNKTTTNHSFCTISSSMTGPFSPDWVVRQQDCSVTMEDDQIPRPMTFWGETSPHEAIDSILEGLQHDKGSRAILLIEEGNALRSQTIGGDQDKLNEHCYMPLSTDEPDETFNGLSDESKHIIMPGTELAYLGKVPGTTHVILFPVQEGSVWDRDTNQVVFDPTAVVRPMAQLRYAMSWRGEGKGPDLHYLGPQEFFDEIEEQPIHSTVYTSHFDEHVLSSLSTWPELPVVELPLSVGRNPYLVEERLRRLMYKGLLEFDETRDQRPRPTGRLRLHSFLKPTLLGQVVSELVDPYKVAIDSAHAACLVGQLFFKMRRTSAAMIDAVCSLAVVLATKNGVTSIGAVIKPEEDFREFNEKEDSLASAHCHRGPIWLAVCVWHFSLTDENWKTLTNPKIRGMTGLNPFLAAKGVKLWFEGTYLWETAAIKVNSVLASCDVEWKPAGVEHRLSSEDLLEVEVMLVTAFLDKLAFVFVPARAGTFGYSATTGAELTRPSDEQMRLIKLDKCWEQEKAVEEQEPIGVYCIFTHCRTYYVDGQSAAAPYDLTYVSARAVRKALERAKVYVADNDLLSKIRTSYKLDL